MKFSQKVLTSLKIVYLNTTIWIDLLSKKYGVKEDGLLEAFSEDSKHNMKYYLSSLISHAHTEYKASPALLKQLSQAKIPKQLDNDYYQIIRQIFQQSHSFSILVTLLRARVLKDIIPALKKVIDLPQFDGYHKFPVDTHLLSSIYHLEHITDPFIGGLFDSLSSEDKEMIKLVTLLHDSGKGRKQEHSVVGATLYKFFAKSLGYNKEMINSGIVLIHNHTLMSNIAQREDLYSEKIILKFASQFKTRRMLNLIYILTYADMNGVSDDIYSTFTARLLKTLYNQSIESLEHADMLDETAMRVKKEKSLQKFKPFMALPRIEQKKILSIPSNLLFLHYNHEKIMNIATEAWKIEDYHYTISNNYFLTIEIISKVNCNLGYILGKLSMFNLANMDICKLSHEHKFFKLDFKEKFQDDELPQVASYIERSFTTNEALSINHIKVNKNDIYIDCDHSKNYALMKLNTKDQRGLIALLITIFDSMNIDIATAKIHTQKQTTRDLFLLEKDSNFCHNRESIINKIAKNE